MSLLIVDTTLSIIPYFSEKVNHIENAIKCNFCVVNRCDPLDEKMPEIREILIKSSHYAANMTHVLNGVVKHFYPIMLQIKQYGYFFYF